MRENLIYNSVLVIAMSFLLVAPAHTTEHRWQAPELQNHPLTGAVYDLRTQAFITSDDLQEFLKRSDYVLIGEKHDNPDHHQLEQEIISANLAETAGSVVFEMLSEDQQVLIKQLQPTDSLDVLKDKLKWNERSWPWADYGKLIHTTLRHGGKVISGNLSTATLQHLYKTSDKQRFTKEQQKTINHIDHTVKEALLEQIYQGHCRMTEKDRLGGMLTIQLARDAMMAWQMANSPQKPVVLVAGATHSRKDLGVPLHLKQLTKNSSTITTLLLVEVQEDLSQPQDYVTQDQADYIWFTPKQVSVDYCANFKRSHTKKTK